MKWRANEQVSEAKETQAARLGLVACRVSQIVECRH